MEVIWYISCYTVAFHTSKLEELHEYKTKLNTSKKANKTPPTNQTQNKHNGKKTPCTDVKKQQKKITFQNHFWEN